MMSYNLQVKFTTDYASSFILFPIKTLPIFINFMSRAILWNSLPPNLKLIQDIDLFKKKYTDYLMNIPCGPQNNNNQIQQIQFQTIHTYIHNEISQSDGV
jgi:hypothetical protein